MKKTWILYLVLIIATGCGALAILTYLHPDEITANLQGVLFLSLMGAIAESQAVVISKDRAITVAFAITLCALLMYGPVASAWVVFLSVLFAVSDLGRGRREHLFNTTYYKTLFNSASYILSALGSGYAYALLGGQFLYGRNFSEVPFLFGFIGNNTPQLIVYIFVYIFVNTVSVALYLTLYTGRNTVRQWFGQFIWSIPSLFVIGLLGVIITVMYKLFGWVAVVLFFGPLMLARYTFVMYSALKKGYLDTIKALSASIEAKDIYTIGHSKRVEEYCEAMAVVLNLPAKRIETLKYAALLHDVGKIGVPEAILNKPGRLTPEELDEIRKHPAIGARMLGDIEFLADAVRIIRAHHVHFDGTGYPPDAAEDGRMLEAQIICAADAYDAMTTDRPYRRAKTHDEAIAELHAMTGTQFAPLVVRAFEKALEKHLLDREDA